MLAVCILGDKRTISASKGDFSTLACTLAWLLDFVCVFSLICSKSGSASPAGDVSSLLKQSLHAAYPPQRRGLQTLVRHQSCCVTVCGHFLYSSL